MSLPRKHQMWVTKSQTQLKQQANKFLTALSAVSLWPGACHSYILFYDPEIHIPYSDTMFLNQLFTPQIWSLSLQAIAVTLISCPGLLNIQQSFLEPSWQKHLWTLGSQEVSSNHIAWQVLGGSLALPGNMLQEDSRLKKNCYYQGDKELPY